MKKTGFKILSLLVVAVMSAIIPVALCACDKVVTEPQAEPYPRDFMCGYFLIFSDGDKAITSENFESQDAVKNYFYKNKFAGGYTTYTVKGWQINHGYVKVEGEPLSTDKSGKVEICDTIRYTSEFNDKWIALLELYYDAESGGVYHSDAIGFSPFGGGLTAMSFGDSMSAKVFDKDGKLQEITYELIVTLQFEQVDKLLETEFSYFTADGERVHSVTTDEFQGSFSADGEYDYVVISKKYEKSDGGTYYKRSVCDKSEQPYTERVFAPCGNGFTRPVDIKIDGTKTEIQPLTVV